jgi:cbb3-type cytochrome oxidase cytochrome c subunit
VTLRNRWIGLGAAALLLPALVVAAPAAKPDPTKGKDLYAKLQCKTCHKLGDEGTMVGPDLSHVGKELTAAKISAKLTNPKVDNPQSSMPSFKQVAEVYKVKVTNADLANLAAYLASLK